MRNQLLDQRSMSEQVYALLEQEGLHERIMQRIEYRTDVAALDTYRKLLKKGLRAPMHGSFPNLSAAGNGEGIQPKGIRFRSPNTEKQNNILCPCGSGRKYKSCCGKKQ